MKRQTLLLVVLGVLLSVLIVVRGGVIYYQTTLKPPFDKWEVIEVEAFFLFQGRDENCLFWEDARQKNIYYVTLVDPRWKEGWMEGILQNFTTDQYIGKRFTIEVTTDQFERSGADGWKVQGDLLKIKQGSRIWDSRGQQQLERFQNLSALVNRYQWQSGDWRVSVQEVLITPNIKSLREGLLYENQTEMAKNEKAVVRLLLKDALGCCWRSKKGLDVHPADGFQTVERIGRNQLQLNLVPEGERIAEQLRAVPPEIKEELILDVAVMARQEYDLDVSWMSNFHLGIRTPVGWFLLVPE